MILVPVKEMSTAKQRLAAVLTPGAAHHAGAHHAEGHLRRPGRSASRGPPSRLVTNDAFATGLARHYDFQIIVDNDNLGESEAIAMATVEAEKRGAQFTMVLPGDIPLLRASEVEAVLAAMPAQGSVLVPAADARGTNAVLAPALRIVPAALRQRQFPAASGRGARHRQDLGRARQRRSARNRARH